MVSRSSLPVESSAKVASSEDGESPADDYVAVTVTSEDGDGAAAGLGWGSATAAGLG